ncbi:hypothetical protein [Roseibaca sp. Y0-43]|uniref:hypothetical protein n=1 Tax=Roseibaca sp. Y0-43 TaxID=2816854 RepID=UPI001D0C44DF|nr:hypothetical protein [Roseibaca sp. Y0-43]
MPMVAITRLRPAEAIDVDCSVVAALFCAHGPLKAEDMLMDHVADLTDRIGFLDDSVQNLGLGPTLVRASAELQDLALLASGIGLTSLATALQASSDAARADNRTALPALWDRVKRIGDQSLVLLWDIPQLRM